MQIVGQEWYLWAYEKKTYLHNKVLNYKQFLCSNSEHEHCEICWARFSNYIEDLHIGYYEEESQSWICCKCFDELKSFFGWKTSKVCSTDLL